MPDANRTQISDDASNPVTATVDGVSVRRNSLTEQIAADRHLSAAVGATKAHRGLRFTKLIPPDGRGQHPE